MSLIDQVAKCGTSAEMLEEIRKPAVLIPSRFTVEDDEYEIEQCDKGHLLFCERHGMPVHEREVESCFEKFRETRDAEYLRKARAIIKHLIDIS